VISKNTRRGKRLRGMGVRHCLLIAAMSAQALFATKSPAQSSTAAQDQSVGDSTEIKEIVVTAQKRSERLVDVPISISVVTPETLSSTNSKNLNELSGAIPGIQFNGNGGGGRTYISLRGTTGSALNTGDEPVAIYMDDVYLARGVTIGAEDLLDVGAIEIVRGPQGTLQGRNATAGAILMRSADPTPKPEGYITATAQNDSQFRTQGAISGPLGNGFEGRVAAGYVSSRGWGNNLFDNTYVGGDWSAQIRGILKYSGDSPLTARIVVDYASVTNQPALFRNAATNFSPLPTGPLVVTPTPTVPLPPAQRTAIYDDNNYSLDPNTRTTVNSDGLSAKFAYAFPSMDLMSITGYRRTSAFGTNNSAGLATPPRLGYNHNDDSSSEVSQEIRLQSPAKQRLSWIVGLYYFHEDQDYSDDIFNLRFSTPTSTGSLYHGNQTTSSYAAFGDSTLSLTDNLQLIGGVRYTRDTKHLNGGIAVTNFDTNLVTNAPYLPPTSTWSDTTYRAKLVYHPMRDLMFFAGYGTGFRAGGYNDFAVQAPFAPEKNDSYEAGVKGDLFERKLSFSLTGYHNKYTNLQLRAGVPSGGAIITNAADSNINGFEMEMTASPFANTRFAANTSYTDAKFASFPHAVDVFNKFVDASGNVLPNAPKWQFFLSAAQDFPLKNGWMLTADANYRWRDTIYFYFTNQDAATERDGPGGSFNARLSLKPNDTWTFAAFGTNLTNARIVTTDVITFSYPEVGLNQPRSYGAMVEAHF
jgi:iron complex outermembrane receptor protein